MKTAHRLEDAYRICRELTRQHYENFPVASALLPKRIRQHIYPIYAFARHADDLADEQKDREALLEWREMLRQTFQNNSPAAHSHPIYLALWDTAQKFNLPYQLFDDLLTAFLQDLDKPSYTTFPELLSYCRYSANPVGRLILKLHGYENAEMMHLSDKICTALQLVNFWQDISVDTANGRRYVPDEYLQHYRLPVENWQAPLYQDARRAMLQALIARTREILLEGVPLLQKLRGRLKWELCLTVWGGWQILLKTEQLGDQVIHQRPKLSISDWLFLGLRLPFQPYPGKAWKKVNFVSPDSGVPASSKGIKT